MEKVIAVKLEVDGGESIAELEKFEHSLSEVNETYKEVGTTIKTTDSKAEQSLKELNAEVKKGGKTFAELRASIEQYKDVAIQAGRNSPVGKQALQDAALLQDQLDGLDAEIRNIAHDGANMQASLQLGQGVLAGYTAFQGVTAMLGVENEELMETMVKLQGAQSVLMGVEQIRMTMEKESFLMQKAKIVQTKVMAGAQLLYATAVGTSSGALKLFRLALISTGIGALIVGVGLLISNFESVSNWVKKVGNMIYDFLAPAIDFILAPLRMLGIIDEKVSKQQVEASKRRMKAIEDERKANEKRRADIDKSIAKNREYTDETQKELQREIDLRKANGENVTGLENKKREQMLASLKIERELALEKLKLIEAEFKARMANGMLSFKQIMEQKKQFQEQLELVKSVHVKLLDEYHAYQVKRAEQRKEARDNEVREQDIKLIESNLEEVRVKVLKAQELMPSLMDIPETEDERYFSGLLGRISEFYDDWEHMDTESKLALSESALNYTNEIMGSISTIVEAVNQSQQMEVDAINATKDKRLSNEKLSALEKFEIEKKSAEAVDKINKKVFERNKKLQIAQATIDGATAVVKALSSAPAPYNFILASAVGTASLAQLNMIRKQRYNSTATSLTPPSFTATDTGSDTTQTSGNGASIGGNQTIINNSPSVSVVEINSTQQRLEDINNISIIGG